MKNYLLYVSRQVVLFILLLFGAGFTCHNTHQQAVQSTNGFALVELFTSEGCSSCPAAEEVLARLYAKQQKQVYLLSYHVDYWDKLGWKDHYSSAAFTKRQNDYAKKMALESIYTPQVVVNGKKELVGSQEGRLNQIIAENLTAGQPSALSFEVKKDAEGLYLHYHVNSKDKLLLEYAWVQPEARDAIGNGENKGRTLHHINIVRSLQTSEVSGNGVLRLVKDKELKGVPLKLIVFLQKPGTLEITGAAEAALNENDLL